MQKIYFVVVGKIKESFYREGVAEYVKRLSRFVKVEIKELAEGANPEAEAEDILRAILEEYDVEESVARQDVEAFFEKLRALDIID